MFDRLKEAALYANQADISIEVCHMGFMIRSLCEGVYLTRLVTWEEVEHANINVLLLAVQTIEQGLPQ